jgi:hypothetical protein
MRLGGKLLVLATGTSKASRARLPEACGRKRLNARGKRRRLHLRFSFLLELCFWTRAWNRPFNHRGGPTKPTNRETRIFCCCIAPPADATSNHHQSQPGHDDINETRGQGHERERERERFPPPPSFFPVFLFPAKQSFPSILNRAIIRHREGENSKSEMKLHGTESIS